MKIEEAQAKAATAEDKTAEARSEHGKRQNHQQKKEKPNRMQMEEEMS